MDITASAIEKLEELSRKFIAPDNVEQLQSVPYAVVPVCGDNGVELQIEDMEKYMPQPARKRGLLFVCDAPSFIEYVEKHKDAGTLVTCSIKGLSVHAVLDHHETSTPGWMEHECRLQLERSPDWDKWMAADGKPMTQSQFAEFLLEMDHTIDEPQAAAIIEIATKLTVESNKKFESKVNIHDGSFTFHLSDEATQTKDQMKMPDKCTVIVAPFRGATPVQMLAYIRYRISPEGKLSLFFKIMNPNDAIETAFEEVVLAVKAGTLLPVLRQA